METSKIIKAKVMLKDRRRSNKNGGMGITMTARIVITPIPIRYS
jgi:hypothetical protein